MNYKQRVCLQVEAVASEEVLQAERAAKFAAQAEAAEIQRQLAEAGQQLESERTAAAQVGQAVES